MKKIKNFIIAWVFLATITITPVVLFGFWQAGEIIINEVPEPQPILIEVKAEVTAYNAVKEQTNDNPNQMANGQKPYIGAIACPRHLPFGTQVLIGNDWFTCADRMNIRYNGNYFDILMENEDEAWEFGRQELLVYLIQ